MIITYGFFQFFEVTLEMEGFTEGETIIEIDRANKVIGDPNSDYFPADLTINEFTYICKGNYYHFVLYSC